MALISCSAGLKPSVETEPLDYAKYFKGFGSDNYVVQIYSCEEEVAKNMVPSPLARFC